MFHKPLSNGTGVTELPPIPPSLHAPRGHELLNRSRARLATKGTVRVRLTIKKRDIKRQMPVGVSKKSDLRGETFRCFGQKPIYLEFRIIGELLGADILLSLVGHV